MSNLIKSRYIYYNQEDKIVIDSNNRSDVFRPLSFGKAVEQGERLLGAELQEEDAEEADLDFGKEKEKIQSMADTILKEANQQAEDMIAKASEQAGILRNQALEEGRRAGYENGMALAEGKTRELRQESVNQIEAAKIEYEKKIKELEPEFAGITASLIEKITGILVEDKKDVILYLISSAIKNLERNNHFMIRVSGEDFQFVNKKKQFLTDMMGEESKLTISEDKSMSKNQCIIETDDRIIDVGLDVQLKNLIESLKLLVNV